MTATLGELIAALGGYAIVLAALFGFISKIWLSRIVDRERIGLQKQLDETNRRLQSELDRSLHISKSQFDNEISNYKAIWSCLIDLRAATLGIRPVLDFVDPNESEADRRSRRISKAREAFAAVREQVEKNKPFYSPEVYEKAQDVIKVCHKETVYAEYTERASHEYWDEAIKNSDKIVATIEETCSAIRSRVWDVRVES